MASRYMLIEFDDAAQADTLRAQIDKATRAGKGFRVVGLFAKPAPPYCNCPKRRWSTTRQGEAKTKTGAKFGWVVCLECKRPVPVMNWLRNLIKPRDIIEPQAYSIAGEGKASMDLSFYVYGLSAQTLHISQFKGD